MGPDQDQASLASVGKDLEKTTHLEVVPTNQYANIGLTAEEAVFFDDFTASKDHKKLLRKIDIRLIPLLALLYLISHIDRANIGNAKIEGLEEDLALTGYQYNIALSIFFVPYVLCEIPSNVILKRVARPSIYLGTLVLLWGVVMTMTGLVNDFGGLVACRFLLGVFESGFFPGTFLAYNLLHKICIADEIILKSTIICLQSGRCNLSGQSLVWSKAITN